MSDLDVSFRLRLVNDLSKEAKRAEEDLKKLDRAVDRLGKGSGNQLDRELADVGRKARESVGAVRSLETEVKKLDRTTTNSVEGEIKALGTASRSVVDDIGRVDAKVAELNRAKTDLAETEIKALGAAARNAIGDVSALDKRFDSLGGMKRIGEIERPASRLNGVMTTLGGSAKSAFAGLAAFMSVDAIVRGLNDLGDAARKLEREVASVAVTAEMRNPETVQKLGQSNTRLATKYGLEQTVVNETRKTFAAAGVDISSQEQILDPTVKAAKASDSDPKAVAESVIAAKQNLGLKDSEIPAYLDQLAKGTKLGSFEVDAVARNFPKLAALYQQTGRGGLDATSELIAFAQIARKTAGTPDQAATNMENILGKIFAPDAQKNFKEKGVDLAKIRDRALANNEPYLMSVVDEVMRITGGDTFKVSELFGDVQAKNALMAMIANRKLYDDWQNQIRNGSGGTVDADYNFLKTLPEERANRRSQAYQTIGRTAGSKFDSFIEPLLDNIARALNAEYNKQRFLEDVPQLDQESQGRQAELEAELKRLQDAGDGGTILGPRMNQIRAELNALREEDAIRKMEQERLTRERDGNTAIDPTTTNSTSDKPITASKRTRDYIPSGSIPVPVDRPVEAAIGKDMSGAAEKSMDRYNTALKAAGERAISIGQDIASKLKSMLNFTATPTISPNMVTPSGTNNNAKVPGKQSSVNTTSSTKVTQNITTPSAVRAARLAVREQNKAVRLAQARAYSDMGSQPA